MNLKKAIPAPEALLHEGLIVLGGLLIAAFILSRMPTVRQFVVSNSLVVKDDANNLLF